MKNRSLLLKEPQRMIKGKEKKRGRRKRMKISGQRPL
jgi:hypothetical protein